MAQASAEKLEHTGLLKRKEWSQCQKVSSWQVARATFAQKKRERSRAISPDHQIVRWERVKVRGAAPW